MIVQKGFLRRFEVWLLLAAAIVVLAVACSGCSLKVGQPDEPERKPEPEPSSVLHDWEVHGVWVVEFRDSGGRICTLAALPNQFDSQGGRAVALDCDELKPLQYEDLPKE